MNSWLVTFGFHLHNTIPGFPVPKFDLSMPSYELSKSQRWDDLPVGTTDPLMLTEHKHECFTPPADRHFSFGSEHDRTDTKTIALFFTVFLLCQKFQAAIS